MIAAAAVASFAPRLARAANYPDRPIKIIVPFAPAGPTDIMARILATHLGEALGGTAVVENRPGAGGNIGIDLVAKSPADGYTIGAATIGHFAINQFLYARMPFDPERDIVPVALIYDQPNIAVVASRV